MSSPCQLQPRFVNQILATQGRHFFPTMKMKKGYGSIQSEQAPTQAKLRHSCQIIWEKTASPHVWSSIPITETLAPKSKTASARASWSFCNCKFLRLGFKNATTVLAGVGSFFPVDSGLNNKMLFRAMGRLHWLPKILGVTDTSSKSKPLLCQHREYCVPNIALLASDRPSSKRKSKRTELPVRATPSPRCSPRVGCRTGFLQGKTGHMSWPLLLLWLHMNCPSWMACCYVCPKEDLPSRVEIGAFESKDKVCDGLQIEHQGCESLSRSKNCSQDGSHLLCCLNTLPLHSSLAANLLL